MVFLYIVIGVNLQNDTKQLLKDGDYSCDSNVMVDGDVFTYPYYWINKVCAVKILHPVTPIQNYFEHLITSPGANRAITIGVVGLDYPLDSHPGWKSEGIGYHADDGKLYIESGHGKMFGPTCTTGDRMGCGVIFEGGNSSDNVKVFFTKNGQQISDFIEFKKPKSDLYPLIGMDTRGDQFQYLGCWNYRPKNGKFYVVYLCATVSIDKYKNNWIKLMGEIGMAVQERIQTRVT